MGLWDHLHRSWTESESFDRDVTGHLPIPEGFEFYLPMGAFADWRYRFADATRNQLSLHATSADLSPLEHLDPKMLWRFAASRLPVDAAQLAPLRKFTKLEELKLDSTGLDDAAVDHIVAIRKLRMLDLDRCRITDAGLAEIAKMKKLEELLLFGTNVTDRGLNALAFHPALRILDLRETKVRGDNFDPLTSIPHLRELRVSFRAAHHARRTFAKKRPDVVIL